LALLSLTYLSIFLKLYLTKLGPIKKANKLIDLFVFNSNMLLIKENIYSPSILLSSISPKNDFTTTLPKILWKRLFTSIFTYLLSLLTSVS
jgi:hypothetical protein